MAVRIFLTLLSLTVIAGSTRGAVFTNSVSADAFVCAAAPTLNYGKAGALSVSGPAAANSLGATNGVFDSFIRFNTAALVTNFDSAFGSNNWAISRATLLVTEVGAPANPMFNRGTGAFEIRWIAHDNWIEGTGTPSLPTTNGITYNEEPALLNNATDASLGAFTNAGMDGSLSFSLGLPAAFVNNLKAGGDVSLYLTAIDPGIGFTFHSHDYGTLSDWPVLEISAAPRPGLLSISVSRTNVVLTGTNGAAGGLYYVLSSTNAAFPLNQWLPVATNVLSASGNFAITVTNAASANAPSRQFFTLRAQ